jgi:hypothetical protein
MILGTPDLSHYLCGSDSCDHTITYAVKSAGDWNWLCNDSHRISGLFHLYPAVKIFPVFGKIVTIHLEFIAKVIYCCTRSKRRLNLEGFYYCTNFV